MECTCVNDTHKRNGLFLTSGGLDQQIIVESEQHAPQGGGPIK